MEFGSGAPLVNQEAQESKEYELANNDHPLNGAKKTKSENPSKGTKTDLNA